MVVMDQFSRKIVGFSVHRGAVDGAAICFMFNKIAAGKSWPKYLSTDNDPLFKYWLWQANLESYYHIDEIKTVPYCPWSHPFIEFYFGAKETSRRSLVYFGTISILIEFTIAMLVKRHQKLSASVILHR